MVYAYVAIGSFLSGVVLTLAYHTVIVNKLREELSAMKEWGKSKL